MPNCDIVGPNWGILGSNCGTILGSNCGIVGPNCDIVGPNWGILGPNCEEIAVGAGTGCGSTGINGGGGTVRSIISLLVLLLPDKFGTVGVGPAGPLP